MKPSQQLTAALQASFVTILWSSSWVFIKLGLRASLPALTFAGLRYTLAFLCLAPFVLLSSTNRAAIRSLKGKDWGQLALLGLILYTLTQGSQFLSLAYLPAAMASLLQSLTPIIVGLFGMIFLGEQPSPGQWFGIALTAAGIAFYFLPVDIRAAQVIGLFIAVVGLCGNTAASLLGRLVNRVTSSSSLIVTFISMGIGSLALLAIGVTVQGFGQLDLQSWLLIAWLAVVNTAFAFTLWNKTLRTLSAVESSVINNLMLLQIAILAFVFLGEVLSGKEIIGLILVSLGVIWVQLRKKQVASLVASSSQT